MKSCPCCSQGAHDKCEDRQPIRRRYLPLVEAVYGPNATACCCESPTSLPPLGSDERPYDRGRQES